MSAASRLGSWFTAPLFRWSVAIIGAVIAGVLVFEALGISVFRRIGMPHEYCYLLEPKLVWLHVITDLLIGAAYVSISATLGYLVYKASKGIPFNWVFLAFGLFIVSCGLTHFMEVWVIWEPVYWLSGYVKVVTAAASVATAVALFPLIPKIFQLIDAARQSEQRRTEIEQLNQELERFNYSVAHDLRAPLRGIAGFSQALEQDFGQNVSEEGKEYLNRIQTCVGRMDTLISDLLRYASVGRQALRLKAVPLDEVLHAAISLIDGEIRMRHAEIVSVTPLPTVLGDPTLLQVVFQNLIGNGIKFVAPGVQPRVEISATTDEGRVRVTFTDNGVGLPEEARGRIFEMFERFHPEQPGTGIGLPIVHRAIERMQGEIGTRSAPHGTGTQFWIELPAA